MMKPRLSALLLAAALVLLAAPGAIAHGGHDHVMGTVKAVDVEAGTLEVETRDGRKVAIRLDAKTKYLRNDAAVKPAELVVGLRVVVDSGKEAGRVVAREIRLGPAPKKP